MTRVDELKASHDREDRDNLLSVLESNGWGLSATARDLGVGISYVQWMIVHHGLSGTYAKRRHPKGRPWPKAEGEKAGAPEGSEHAGPSKA